MRAFSDVGYLADSPQLLPSMRKSRAIGPGSSPGERIHVVDFVFAYLKAADVVLARIFKFFLWSKIAKTVPRLICP